MIIYKRFLKAFLFLLLGACTTIDSQEVTDQESAKIDPLTAHDDQINELISKMTLEEKVSMIHANSSFTSAGVERLGIPELTMSDGPHGVRPEHGRGWDLLNDGTDSSTYLPTGVTLAATWNPELGYAFGGVLGSEANKRGKDVILGPGINIMRTPLNGRNFEYQSEDPYLISKMAVGYIKGVQDQGVAACVKHFIANNQEIRRSSINVAVGERAFREIYLPGFKAAVEEAQVMTLMGAYNQFRGEFATHNALLINDILKGEWGFEGMVISDWGAVHDTKQALQNGTDLEMGTDLSQMPNIDYGKFFLGDTVVQMVKSGDIAEALIDDKVKRILRVMYATHMFDKRQEGSINTEAHHKTAQKVAEEGIVLLKNDDQLLPLSKEVKKVAVIGGNADAKQSLGGGSSQVRPPYEITPLAGIKSLLGADVEISYVPGFEVIKPESANSEMIAEAVAAAKEADYVVYVGGWNHGYNYSEWGQGFYDMEGVDKPSMKLPFFQDELISAVIDANPMTVVVLMGGGPVDMSQWIDNAPAIVQAWYPGMEGGKALAKILYGEVNPSGKLPVTFPKQLEDSPAHALGEYPGDTANVFYNEGIFVGYRYNDTYKVEPQFAFGHGLSYTTFTFSDLKLTKEGEKVTGTFTLQNRGDMDGAEVAQIYVHDKESSLKRPVKELKAFEKVFLNKGESKEISFTLEEDAFKYYDDTKNGWILEPGDFEIMVGNASDNITLSGAVTFE